MPTKYGSTASAGSFASATGSGVGTVTGVADFRREDVDSLRKDENDEDLEILSKDPVDARSLSLSREVEEEVESCRR